jgi:RNA recognition motif-containing protein
LKRKKIYFRNETSEDEIRNIFSQYGTIKRFKFFEKDRKMALIEMETSEEAIAALIVRMIMIKINFLKFFFLV